MLLQRMQPPPELTNAALEQTPPSAGFSVSEPEISAPMQGQAPEQAQFGQQ
jgi:hypothetical protein